MKFVTFNACQWISGFVLFRYGHPWFGLLAAALFAYLALHRMVKQI